MTEDLAIFLQVFVRTAAVATVAAILGRIVIRRSASAAHAVWVLAAICELLVAALTISSLRPVIRIPAAAVIAQIPVHSIDTLIGQRSSQPWEHVRYRRRSSSLGGALIWIWVGGAFLGLARIAASARLVRRIRKSAAPAEIGNQIVAASQDVTLPITFGIFKPMMVLPVAAAGWNQSTLRAVIAHEMAHARRRDPLWRLVSELAWTLLWFQPLAWLVRDRVITTAELASDELAAESVGAVVYAKALVAVAEEAALFPGHRFDLLSPAMSAGSSLTSRVDRVLAQRAQVRTRSSFNGAIILLPFAAALLAAQFRDASPLLSNPVARELVADIHAGAPQARADAAFRLARWQKREEEALPLLIKTLGDSAPIHRMPRWDYLQEGWAPAIVSFEQPSPGEVAALGLASFGARAAESLEDVLLSANPVARRNAAWAIGEMRHPRVVSARGIRRIESLLADPDSTVRAAAAWTLGDLGAASSAPYLRKMLRSEKDPRVSRLARQSLNALEANLNLEAFRHP